MIGHISFDDIIRSLFLNFSNNGHARLLIKISAARFTVFHKVIFDSFFGKFCLNPEMTNSNKICSCDGFDQAGNLSCSWIITENWSILAIESFFVNFVGKVDNLLQEFYFCESFQQSTKLSLCGTSWTVILFPWLPIDQRITKENAGSTSAFSCFFTESKITVSEGK